MKIYEILIQVSSVAIKMAYTDEIRDPGMLQTGTKLFLDGRIQLSAIVTR